MKKVTGDGAWVPVCLGLVTGTSLGRPTGPMGWIVIQLCVLALLYPLARHGVRARAVGFRVGLFTSAWVLSALAPIAQGVPAPLDLVVWLPMSLLVLAQGCVAGLFAAVASQLTQTPARRMLLALPASWALQEWVLGIGPWAMPWVRLAYGSGVDGLFAGVLPWGGTLLAGSLSITLSGVLAIGFQRRGEAGAWRFAVVIAALLAAGGLGARVTWTDSSGNQDVTLAQPGHGADSRSADGDKGVRDTLVFFDRAVGDRPVGLFISPELALDKTFDALPRRLLDSWEERFAAHGADGLLGMHFEPDVERPGLHNGALVLGASGRQRYIKSRLVPFGESNPLGDWARWLVPAWGSTAYGLTLAGADDGEPLVVAGHRAALALCYEVSFGDSLRRRAASADLLVAMTNDSAIDSEVFTRQAVRVSRARAIELQKPMLRVSDVMGTMVIGADGAVLAETPAGEAVVLRAQVRTMTGLTPYGRFGDRLPVSLAALALLIAALPAPRSYARGLRRPSALAARIWPMAGQVLPAAVGLLLVIASVFYLMVNTGQTVTEKMRVTNAADAAAYSAGVVEARALNYDAYTNRAIVANEIGIAQMVSLASWLDYFATGADNFGANLMETNTFVLPDPKVAVLDAAFVGTNYISAYTGTTAQEYADYIIEYGLAPIITLHNSIAEALSLSQKAVRANLTAGIRQQQIANDVVRAMDPALSAVVLPTSHGFDNFTKSYAKSGGPGDERGRLADVVMRSRDAFTRERSWTAKGFDFPTLRKDGALKKRGGTELIGYDEWRAVDTLELHGRTWGCGKLGLSWCDDIQRPIGWGATEVDAGGGDAGRGYHGNAYGENPTTANRAETTMRRPTYAYFTGIPDSQELRDLDAGHDITSGITIRVTKAQSATLTSGGAAQNKPSGSLALFNDKPAGGQLTALSRAQVYFDRIAARADGKTEIGSLYNPYWRVRLVAPTPGDKAAAAVFQGGMALP